MLEPYQCLEYAKFEKAFSKLKLDHKLAGKSEICNTTSGRVFRK